MEEMQKSTVQTAMSVNKKYLIEKKHYKVLLNLSQAFRGHSKCVEEGAMSTISSILHAKQ